MDDLLAEFDPLSASNFNSKPRAKPQPSSHSGPLFPEPSSSKHPWTNGASYSLPRSQPPARGAVTASSTDDDPLAALFANSSSTPAFAPPAPTPLAEAQRRTQLRQDALHKHLAKEPFQPPSKPGTPLLQFSDLPTSSQVVQPPSSGLPARSIQLATPFLNHTHHQVPKSKPEGVSKNGTKGRVPVRSGPPVPPVPRSPLDDDFADFVSETAPKDWGDDDTPQVAYVPPAKMQPPLSVTGTPLRSMSNTPLNAVKLRGNRGGSELSMDEDLAEGVRSYLPRRLRLSAAWDLLYSLDRDGTSLATLYARVGTAMRGDSTAGCIIVVKDADGHRFGAFVNEALKPSREYYGSGECFLWRSSVFEPGDFRIGTSVQSYPWTGENNYMVLSDAELLSVGGGDGKFGLCIDAALEKGVSARCPAFNNDVLCGHAERNSMGREEGSFDIIAVEVWAPATS